jgi:hemolysin activation/secretion protein
MVSRRATQWFLAIVATLALSTCPLQQVHAQNGARPVLLDGSLVGYPRLEVRGMTVYEPAETWNFALAHVLQTEGAATALQMAKAIELIYREDGYFLARVHVVPGAQPGTAILLVEEGHIGTIEIIGVGESIGERIASYMKPVTDGGPVKLADFERALMLAGDLSGVSVRSEVRYREGGEPDKADLKIYANSIKARGSIVVDSPPAADSLTATVLQEVYSTLFAGDLLRGIVGVATDFSQSVGGTIGGYYRVPIWNQGTYAEVYAGSSKYGRDLAGVLNNNYQQGFNAIALVGHPLLRTLDEYAYLLFENDYGELASWTGQGRDRSDAFRMTMLYSRVASAGTETKIGMTFSAGWAGSDNPSTIVDSTFWHVRAGFGTGVALDWLLSGLGFRTETLAQFTDSSLPATEKFWLGERERNRGYPIAVVTGDSGFSSSFGLHKHFNVNNAIVKAIAPYVFFDIGYASTNQGVAQGILSTPVLASTGVGARMYLDREIMLSGWFGVPLVSSFNGQTYGPTAFLRLTKSW